MLQVAFIRKNVELVKERLKIKNFSEVELVDRIVAMDDERKKMQFDVDEIQAKLNNAAKEIGKLMAKGDGTAADLKKNEVAAMKTTVAGINQTLQETEKKLNDILVLLPNLPHSSVPAGTSPEQNIIIKEVGAIPKLYEGAVPHWDLAKKYDLINFELGNKIAGSGFPFFKNNGAKLQRALVQYFLEYNIAAGYTEYQPPLLVNEATAFGTGQLPDKEAQMYQATADNLYLIPTSEVPLTNIYRDEIVKENELPIRMTAYTPCFRREAGSYGKDVRGLNRVHQFDKVEIVQIVLPEKSYEVLEQMVEHVGKLLQSLQLPYRILRLCGGDLGFASAITYDFEVYSAAQQKWLEVSSVSNFETFQTNRMKVRYKDSSGKTQLLHSLNGSSLALPRIMACLLENNQTADNIQLPEVLHNYFGGREIK
jgi:seryl-tRNA synthetase